MKVIHIARNTDGYEIVTLLSNRISKNNRLSLIERDGEQHMTGGFILNNTKEIRDVLDNISRDRQYDFIYSIKSEPFVRTYADESYGDSPALI